jgi:hypothetical protein
LNFVEFYFLKEKAFWGRHGVGGERTVVKNGQHVRGVGRLAGVREGPGLSPLGETKGRSVPDMEGPQGVHEGVEASPSRAHVGRVHVLFGHVLQCLYRRMDPSWLQEHYAEAASLQVAAGSVVVGVGAGREISSGFFE